MGCCWIVQGSAQVGLRLKISSGKGLLLDCTQVGSSHVPMVMEQMFGRATFAQVVTAELWPCMKSGQGCDYG